MKSQIFRSGIKFVILSLVLLLGGSLFNFGQSSRELVQENKELPNRTALVIGNGDYVSARKLSNPVNDATDVSKSLSELGFEVITGVNLNLRQMNEKVREFGDRLKVNGGVGLFYYAGHGVQVSGKNYLIPIEADIPREDEVDFNAFNLDIILRKMGTANNGLNIVILDACRNNPFARSWTRGENEGGLAQINAPVGTFIAYATSPDRTASDGEGRNGLYTAELLKVIKQPNLKIEEAFKKITIAVDSASSGKQVPWTSSSLRGDFFFNLNKNSKSGQKFDKQVVVKDSVTRESEAWDLVKTSSDEQDYRLFLKEFPNGVFAERAKLQLEEVVWLQVKSSMDSSRIQNYLNEFPNGNNASSARILLRQLENKQTQPEKNTQIKGKWLKVNVTVFADERNNGWTNTGYLVRKGTKIKISAVGEVNLGKGNLTTPEGLISLADKGKLIQNAETGGLIGVIGDDNNDFIFIGSSFEFTAKRDGVLFLGVNEGNLADNTGKFEVIVEFLLDQ